MPAGDEVIVPAILIVEDERDVQTVLDFNLKAEGFETLRASNGEEALAWLRTRVPDLVLLDLMLPDLPGTEICRRIKADPRTSAVPVVVLSARGEEVDRVVLFELGADDYVRKPFSVRELVLRLRAVLRRTSARSAPTKPVVTIGPIVLDREAHRCTVDGRDVVLTPIEFKLLGTLMDRAGRAQSREQLLTEVWELSEGVESRTVDTHVKRLRDKLRPAHAMIETVRGLGYRLREPKPRRRGPELTNP
jgi:two-component system phosphate regulon response regulator PhoB